jgi:hypothetical protein
MLPSNDKHLPKSKGGLAPAVSKPLLGALNWHGYLKGFLSPRPSVFRLSWHAFSLAWICFLTVINLIRHLELF